jgi:uncharacterized protein (TIGR02270 family)
LSQQVRQSVVEQHAELAAFLWTARDGAVTRPRFTLKTLARFDGRLEANLDGLRIAGEAGYEAVAAARAGGEPGAVFASAALAFGVNTRARIDAVLALRGDPAAEREIVAALAWLPFETVRDWIRALFLDADVAHRRIGIAAAACHRKDPGDALEAALRAEDRRLCRRALEAAGELGRTDLIPALEAQLIDADAACRFAAAWSALRLGRREGAALQVAGAVTETATGNLAEAAARIVVRCLDRDPAMGWIRHLAADPATRRAALAAAGARGDPALLPGLVAAVEDPALARLAGEELSLVAGIDLALAGLEAEAPAADSGPSDDPADDDVAPDPEADLPWPAPAKVAAWWQEARGRFEPGTRYLRGRKLSPAAIVDTLRHGPQRQREAAALEAALAAPAHPLFALRAPVARQKAALAKP